MIPPDAVYNIIIDPENKRVLKNIKEVISRKVLLEKGSRQVVEVELAATGNSSGGLASCQFMFFLTRTEKIILLSLNKDEQVL